MANTIFQAGASAAPFRCETFATSRHASRGPCCKPLSTAARPTACPSRPITTARCPTLACVRPPLRRTKTRRGAQASMSQTSITPDGHRCDTASAYLFNETHGALRHCANISVLTDAQVAKLLMVDGPRCAGVVLCSGHTVRGSEVVLCAGAVGSPHLLMLSGIGPQAHLESKGASLLRARTLTAVCLHRNQRRQEPAWRGPRNEGPYNVRLLSGLPC